MHKKYYPESHTFSVFGSLDAFGYEEAWNEKKLNVKVDVFSTEVFKAKILKAT